MGRRAYVGNIPFSTNEQELRDWFAPRRLVDCKVITDRETGRPRGFAFVEFETEADMQSAIAERNEQFIGERRVVVNEAAERPKGGGRAPRDHGEERRGGKRDRW